MTTNTIVIIDSDEEDNHGKQRNGSGNGGNENPIICIDDADDDPTRIRQRASEVKEDRIKRRKMNGSCSTDISTSFITAVKPETVAQASSKGKEKETSDMTTQFSTFARELSISGFCSNCQGSLGRRTLLSYAQDPGVGYSFMAINVVLT